MLTGTSGRWKQIVAHHMTGSSTEAEEMKKIIYEIIHRAEKIGLNVNNITSDMGGSNVALWKLMGVGRDKNTNTLNNSVDHPVDSCRRLYIIAAPSLKKFIELTIKQRNYKDNSTNSRTISAFIKFS